VNSLEIETHPDFDGHEMVEHVDSKNLTAFIAVHDSNLGLH